MAGRKRKDWFSGYGAQWAENYLRKKATQNDLCGSEEKKEDYLNIANRPSGMFVIHSYGNQGNLKRESVLLRLL